MRVGIIGYGWVGKYMHELFPDAEIYSHNLVMGVDGAWFKNAHDWEQDEEKYKDAVNQCDIAFICVPTPNEAEGRLDVSQVEEAIKWCKAKIIVIRSTVNPGDTYKFKKIFKKRIVFQPEYLGETPDHPLLDPKGRKFIILGGDYEDNRKVIELYQEVYNANVNIRQVNDYTAEVIKLTENRSIAFRVAECQELYDACEASLVDYYTVREAVYGDDPRMNLWWTFVYPKARGFNSKCIPKDVYAWRAWAESSGIDPTVTKAILKQNKKWIKSNDKK